MKSTNAPLTKRARTALALVLALAPLSPLAFSQEEEEDVFTLSPFEVNADEDVGYAAQNTLAGSRLNTSLKDVASPLEVFTKEFIEDIGATTLEDAFAYHTNAQEDLGDENNTMQQDYKAQSQVRTRFKVRGMSQTRSRDYFTFALPIDLFSTERVDASRGPNSILFGVGNAGGMANVSSKKARVGKDSTSIGLSFGSGNVFRATVDRNQVLIDNKLAVRVNLLKQDGESWTAHGRDDKEGIQLATTWKVSDNTTVRTDYEYGTKGDMATRTYPIISRGYYWDLAGRPTFDPTVYPTDNSIGTADDYSANYGGVGDAVTRNTVDQTGNNNQSRFIYIENNGMTFNSANRYQLQAQGVDRMLPQEVIYGTMINGPGARRDLEYSVYSASIEHKFTDNLFAEIAVNRSDSDWFGYTFGNEAFLTGEASTAFVRNAPNSALADGLTQADVPDVLPHEFAGLYYYEDVPRFDYRSTSSKDIRATVSYELKTERWGTHRFAGMLSKNDKDFVVQLGEARAITNPDEPEKSQRLFSRHYITDESDPADFRNVDVRDLPDSMLDPFTGNTYDISMPRQADRHSVSGYTSDLFSMQNFWLNRKLITTFGVRNDDAYTISYGTNTIGNDGLPTGEVNRDPITNEMLSNINDIERDVTNKSTTTTTGVVYHVTPKFALTYNNSSNVGPPYGAWGGPDNTRPIDTERLIGTGSYEPLAPTGTGEDYGIKLSLFENKVYITANYFKTEGTGALTSRSGPYDGAAASVISALAGDQGYINWLDDNGETITDIIGYLQVDGSGNIVETAVLDGDGNPTTDFEPVYAFGPNLIPAEMPRPDFDAQDDDFTSEGYELSMTANINKNINIRAGYSYTTRETTDQWRSARVFAQKLIDWVNSDQDFDSNLLANLPVRRYDNLETWHEGGTFAQDSQGRYYLTANDVLQYDILARNLEARNEAIEGFGQRPHKANIWASYKFNDGKLKGMSIFGGLRYQSGAEIGYRQYVDENGDTIRDTSVTDFSGSRLDNDAGLSYSTKANWFTDGARIRYQINVRNIFDDTDYQVARYRTDIFGEQVAYRYYVPTPRSTTVRATISF